MHLYFYYINLFRFSEMAELESTGVAGEWLCFDTLGIPVAIVVVVIGVVVLELDSIDTGSELGRCV